MERLLSQLVVGINMVHIKKVKFCNYLYDITLDRIGIYGGLAITSDPLSTLHAGFNYAISKDIFFNLGWTWTNEITPQITKIGNITSLADAEQYAQRKYSKPQFALGLSFSPSSVIKMLGIKSSSSTTASSNGTTSK